MSCEYQCIYVLQMKHLLIRRSCSGALHFSLVDDVEAGTFLALSNDVSSCMYVCMYVLMVTKSILVLSRMNDHIYGVE